MGDCMYVVVKEDFDQKSIDRVFKVNDDLFSFILQTSMIARKYYDIMISCIFTSSFRFAHQSLKYSEDMSNGFVAMSADSAVVTFLDGLLLDSEYEMLFHYVEATGKIHVELDCIRSLSFSEFEEKVFTAEEAKMINLHIENAKSLDEETELRFSLLRSKIFGD